MKILARFSTAFLAIGLALPIWSSFYMISFVQPERAQIAAGRIHFMFSYENYVHEAGFARLTLSVVALLILFVPYQRRERWAFAALIILAVAYYVPVYSFGAIPNLGTWGIFRSLPEPRTISLQEVALYAIVLNALLAIGLATSAPLFFRKKNEHRTSGNS